MLQPRYRPAFLIDAEIGMIVNPPIHRSCSPLVERAADSADEGSFNIAKRETTSVIESGSWGSRSPGTLRCRARQSGVRCPTHRACLRARGRFLSARDLEAAGLPLAGRLYQACRGLGVASRCLELAVGYGSASPSARRSRIVRRCSS
jgi:hypothetical protein